MLLLLIIIAAAAAFAIAGFVGAPYVPILGRDTRALLELVELKPGQTLVDLGAGDGRLLRAAAARGIRGIGYEINPIMVAVAWLLCFPMRSLISVHLANLWSVQIPDADVIYVFLMPKFMERLDHHLQQQIKRPTRVVSYAFKIPGRQPIAQNRNTFVYQYTPIANDRSQA